MLSESVFVAIGLMTLPEGWTVMPGSEGHYFWPRLKDGVATGKHDFLIECKDPSLIICIALPDDPNPEALSAVAKARIERVMKMHTEGRYAPWPEPGEVHSPDVIYWPQRYVLRDGQRIEM